VAESSKGAKPKLRLRCLGGCDCDGLSGRRRCARIADDSGAPTSGTCAEEEEMREEEMQEEEMREEEMEEEEMEEEVILKILDPDLIPGLDRCQHPLYQAH